MFQKTCLIFHEDLKLVEPSFLSMVEYENEYMRIDFMRIEYIRIHANRRLFDLFNQFELDLFESNICMSNRNFIRSIRSIRIDLFDLFKSNICKYGHIWIYANLCEYIFVKIE